MSAFCSVCGASTDANLCRRCTGQIVEALAGLGRDIADLVAVETRQASGPLGNSQWRQWDAPPQDGARPVTPWVFAPGADDQLWAIDNTVTTWARHIAEARRVKIRLRPPRIFRVDSRGHGTIVPITQAERVARWLLDNIESVRRDEAAAQIHEEITGLAEENDRAVVGSRGTDEFYGVCDQLDVRVDGIIWLGPRCVGSFDTCEHESCRLALNLEPVLRTRVATCGAQLYAATDALTVSCQACGASYLTAERKHTMREALPDSVGTLAEVAGALTKLDAPVNVDALDSAIRRGHIQDRGRNAQGHRLVRVGDVEAYLKRRAEQLAKRRKITVA